MKDRKRVTLPLSTAEAGVDPAGARASVFLGRTLKGPSLRLAPALVEQIDSPWKKCYPMRLAGGSMAKKAKKTKKTSTAKKATRADPTVRPRARAGSPASGARICDDQRAVRLEVQVGDPGIVRSLTAGLDLSKYYIYLDSIAVEQCGAEPRFNSLITNEMSEEWEAFDGLYRVSVWGSLVVLTDGVATTAVRKALLDAGGGAGSGRMSFRLTGDSDPLVEGTDFEWVKPFQFEVCDPELIGPDEY